MRRFWVSKENIEGDQVQFEGEVFHHLVEVSRFKEGQVVEVLTGDKDSLVVKLTEVQKKKALGKVIDRRALPEVGPPYINVALSIPRFQKMDEIIEKCVELGVTAVWPFVSDHSFVRKVSKLPEGKIRRWEKIIRSASEQSGRAQLMRLGAPQSLSELLKAVNQKSSVLGLFPYEGQCDTSVKAHLRERSQSSFEEIWIFVGSEGGFSEDEVELMRSQGYEPLSLGGHILRVETACLAMVSILKYEFDIQ